MFMKTAQQRKLPGELKSEGHRLYEEFELLARDRNRIIHGTWAWSEQYVNSLFLVQPRSLGIQLNRVFSGIHNIATRPQQYSSVSIDLSRGTSDEYTHDDFEEVVRKITELRAKIMSYGNKVLAHTLNLRFKRET